MLFNIVYSENDNSFAEIVKAIEKAYFDSTEYNQPKELTPNWTIHDIPPEEEQIKEINQRLNKQVEKVCTQESEHSGKYIYFNNEGIEKGKFALPFIDRLHRYFLERKWNKPPIIDSINLSIDELVCLEPTSGHTRFQNCSKNVGNYNHFMNVSLATARLIQYFTDENHIAEFLYKEKHNSDKWQRFSQTVAFKKKNYLTQDESLRILNLMLAAFLHDIGKTIVDHRHGMEGSIIISEHTSLSWYQLHIIAKNYNADFQRNDLLFVADLLNFHDQFGTLSTGEAGYAQLNDLTESIKRYSLKYTSKADQVMWSEKYLFDLWLLNVADIMVSVKDKWKRQKEWATSHESKQKIEKFIADNSHHIYTLTHDLHIANQLVHSINNHRHTDIYSNMRQNTKAYSDRHVIERINRLISTCILKSVETIISKKELSKNFKNMIENLRREKCLSESEVSASIERAVSATRDWEEFCHRFSWIGQMDYSLGFFMGICLRALDRVDFELQDNQKTNQGINSHYNETVCFRTKWIREKCLPGFEQPEAQRVLYKLNATLFVENFTVTVVKIIDHLLFRSGDFNRIKNIEFNETRNRLSDEKIDTILGFNGPYNAERAIELILKTVFIY